MAIGDWMSVEIEPLLVLNHEFSIEHHYLLLTDGFAIHQSQGSTLPDTRDPIQWVRTMADAEVRIDREEDIILGRPTIYRGTGGRYAVERAVSRLGDRDYHPTQWNCEHFASWCVTGIARSEQIEDLMRRHPVQYALLRGYLRDDVPSMIRDAVDGLSNLLPTGGLRRW